MLHRDRCIYILAEEYQHEIHWSIRLECEEQVWPSCWSMHRLSNTECARRSVSSRQTKRTWTFSWWKFSHFQTINVRLRDCSQPSEVTLTLLVIFFFFFFVCFHWIDRSLRLDLFYSLNWRNQQVRCIISQLSALRMERRKKRNRKTYLFFYFIELKRKQQLTTVLSSSIKTTFVLLLLRVSWKRNEIEVDIGRQLDKRRIVTSQKLSRFSFDVSGEMSK